MHSLKDFHIQVTMDTQVLGNMYSNWFEDAVASAQCVNLTKLHESLHFYYDVKQVHESKLADVAEYNKVFECIYIKEHKCLIMMLQNVQRHHVCEHSPLGNS